MSLTVTRLRRVSVCLSVSFFVIPSCLAILAPLSSNLMPPNIYSVHLLATDLLAQFSGLNYPMIHMMHNWKVSICKAVDGIDIMVLTPTGSRKTCYLSCSFNEESPSESGDGDGVSD